MREMGKGNDTIFALARSKAGHDKGRVFVVTGDTGDHVKLCDGKGRTLQKPKIKNRIHVQFITHLDNDLLEQMKCINGDEDIRRILKSYQKMLEVMHVEE